MREPEKGEMDLDRGLDKHREGPEAGEWGKGRKCGNQG